MEAAARAQYRDPTDPDSPVDEAALMQSELPE
jgi:hypothetical protein